MRKQIALILAVAVMLCMPVRAAAESTTITTVVPEPAYQMTIPADIQMEYRAGSCTIGVPSIAQSSGFGEKAYLTVADLQPDGRWQRDPLRTYGRRQNPIGF